MKIIKHYEEAVGGQIIKNDENYILSDNRHLKKLVLSKTVLKPRQRTNGHSHVGIEEIYFFMSPAQIKINEKLHYVEEGDTVLIDDGEFHQVFNGYDTPCTFISVFQAYDRRKK